MAAGPSRSPLPHVLLAIYVVVCLVALNWPDMPGLSDGIEPRLFGLPFAFGWTVLWVVLTFVVLVLYNAAIERQEHE